jgi:uncharacterized protein YuzE
MTYDHIADSAKIYLVDAVAFGTVARSTHCDLDVDAAAVNLDFDIDGRLLAIELLGASRLLPDDFRIAEPLEDVIARTDAV